MGRETGRYFCQWLRGKGGRGACPTCNEGIHKAMTWVNTWVQQFWCFFRKEWKLSPATLLQGLTLLSGTQTGCHRLDSYMEQKKFLACGPEFSVEFSVPPEFSGGVTEKYLSTGWARTFDLKSRKQIFYHRATAPLCTNSIVFLAAIFQPFL